MKMKLLVIFFATATLCETVVAGLKDKPADEFDLDKMSLYTALVQGKAECKKVTNGIVAPNSPVMNLIRKSYGEVEVQHVMKIANDVHKKTENFTISVFSYPKDYEDFIIKQGWSTAQALENEKDLESSYDRILTGFSWATVFWRRNISKIPKKMAEDALELLNRPYTNFAYELVNDKTIDDRVMSDAAKPTIEKGLEILCYQMKRFCVNVFLKQYLIAVAEQRLGLGKNV